MSREIRDYLLNVVQNTAGHMASTTIPTKIEASNCPHDVLAHPLLFGSQGHLVKVQLRWVGDRTAGEYLCLIYVLSETLYRAYTKRSRHLGCPLMPRETYAIDAAAER